MYVHIWRLFGDCFTDSIRFTGHGNLGDGYTEEKQTEVSREIPLVTVRT